jgi:hypothetical protein
MSFHGQSTNTFAVVGVGYFDPAHGQVGRAPNNIEIHPILSISFSEQTENVALRMASPSTTNVASAKNSPGKEAAETPAGSGWQYTMITADSTDRLLTDPQTVRPRMRQQQEHQQCSDERHIFREVNHVDLLHLGVVHLPEGVHLEGHAQQKDD